LQDAKASRVYFLNLWLKSVRAQPENRKKGEKWAFLIIHQYIDALQACSHGFGCRLVNSDSKLKQMEIFLPGFRDNAPLKNQILQITDMYGNFQFSNKGMPF
jgi:hypothetical protein